VKQENQAASGEQAQAEFKPGLGLFDSVMIVAGIMIGSGIFIVSAQMSRQIGSAGWLLVAWVITGVLTICGALTYGELAAMIPRAGGMYVYLREAFSPMWGFLYGWTLWTVIQTGSIAAVAIAFARFSGVLFPKISESGYIIAPVHISSHYAFSLSTAQALAIAIIVLLTLTNCRGLNYGKIVQNTFTVAKIGALLALIVLGLAFGANWSAVHANFHHMWATAPSVSLASGLTAMTAAGLFVAICISQTGSLFSADSWHNITFVAPEVKRPHRTLPLALLIGTGLVIVLYLLANVAYLVTLPLPAMQTVKDDRLATAVLSVVFPRFGAGLMAAALMISTFGCVNALTLAGARASYAMAKDRLFFGMAKRLNKARVPGWALLLQGGWAVLLVLPRTYNPATGQYGNLYSNLLDFVISAELIFYILTIASVFRFRRTRPHAERPYRTWGYPVVPAIYILGAATILTVLFIYNPTTTWPGVAIVAIGVPVYFLIRPRKGSDGTTEETPVTAEANQ
jgi:APA family basic amino acid/polyamine antiporter